MTTKLEYDAHVKRIEAERAERAELLENYPRHLFKLAYDYQIILADISGAAKVRITEFGFRFKTEGGDVIMPIVLPLHDGIWKYRDLMNDLRGDIHRELENRRKKDEIARKKAELLARLTKEEKDLLGL